MGKSFNDDVFNNGFNLDSINGLNISKEAIEENQEKSKTKIDISNINLDEVKEQLKKQKEQKDPQDELKELMQAQNRLKEKEQEHEQEIETIKNNANYTNTIYIKKTMIFKKEYLDIIDGLASINDMQIKDVLNQLLERAINDLDEKTKEKAIKTSQKQKPVKTEKNIF